MGERSCCCLIEAADSEPILAVGLSVYVHLSTYFRADFRVAYFHGFVSGGLSGHGKSCGSDKKEASLMNKIQPEIQVNRVFVSLWRPERHISPFDCSEQNLNVYPFFQA